MSVKYHDTLLNVTPNSIVKNEHIRSKYCKRSGVSDYA